MMVRRLGDLESDLFRVLDWKRRTLTYKLKVEERLGCDIDQKSNVALYPALYHFDSSDWSNQYQAKSGMTKLSVVLTMLIFIFQRHTNKPPTARRMVDSPLSRALTLEGRLYLAVSYYGDSGLVPHTFFLREERNIDVGILKLFLLEKEIDLSDVAQSSTLWRLLYSS